jgi:hypothetical protein
MSRIGDRLDDLTYPVRRGARNAASVPGDFWFSRSLSFRRRTAGVIGILLLYVLLKAVVVPLLPCDFPAADSCAPSDDAAEIVPGDALLYAHVSLEGPDYGDAKRLAAKLPHAGLLLRAGTGSIGLPSRTDPRALEPWLGNEVAAARLPGAAAGKQVLLAAAKDPAKAIAFADSLSGKKPRTVAYKGTSIRTYNPKLAAAVSEGFLLLGDPAAIRRVIDTERFPGASLAASTTARAARDALPEDRFADLYISQAGVRALLVGRGGYAGQLDTFTDYSASKAIAVSAQAQGGGAEFQIESVLDPTLAAKHPPVFKALASFHPTLATELSGQALIYLGVGSLANSINSLLSQAAKTSPGLAGELRSFLKRLSGQTSLNVTGRLLPLLRGEAALGIEPSARVPYVTMIVKGVDTKAANAAILQIAPALARSAGARGSIATDLKVDEVDGVRTASVRLSPTVDLTMASFDGKLVVSSDPAGVAQVRAGKTSLSGQQAYKATTSHVDGKVSALVFLNLEELFGLASRAGLAQNPAYATFRDDISKLRALAVGVDSLEDRLSTKIFITIE